MSTVKLGIGGLNASGLILKASLIHEKMDGNANFPAPNPTLAELAAARDNLQVATLEAENRDSEKIAIRKLREEDMKDILRRLGSYVQDESGGEEEKILSSGFEVRKLPEPIGIPAVPQNLRTVPGGSSGIMDIRWGAVRGAQSYVVQFRDLSFRYGDEPAPLPGTGTEPPEEGEPLPPPPPEPIVPDDAEWHQLTVSTRSRFRATSLPSGHILQLRVAAIGAAGQGAWSDIAERRVL